MPLYFSAERPTVIRDGVILMVDDDRFPLLDGEEVQMRSVRFRTLGCYPLSGGVTEPAYTAQEILADLLTSNVSARAGRLIDGEGGSSMESKKAEGYF